MPLLYETYAATDLITVEVEPYLYLVKVNSEPPGIPFKVNGVELETPAEFGASKESYTLVFPPTFEGHDFQHWEDDSTEPTRTIFVDKDLNLLATYKKPWYKEPWVIPAAVIGITLTIIGLAALKKRKKD